ncbi:hypothetical protein [Flectobacillus major]|jgi:hypothetical protein|uniref:hypothetical protein n=1 Tax=Flectobacillus major TaxID=103 RepID=UPI0003F93ADC|nr:hypothetical protein [Flectobacillus major]
MIDPNEQLIFEDDPAVPELTIIQAKSSENLVLLLGALGSLIYVVYFFNQANYWVGLVLLILATWLTVRYMKQSSPRPKLILSLEGIQLVGQPFVSWALVHSLQIRPDVKKDTYTETLVFVNNGRIQEIPLAQLAISAWQLEHLLEIYQGRFRHGTAVILPDDESELSS